MNNMQQQLNSTIAQAEHIRSLYEMDAVEHSSYQTYREAMEAIDHASANLRCAVKEDWAAWNARR